MIEYPLTGRTLTGVAFHPSLKGHEWRVIEALMGCTDYGVLLTRLSSRQDVLFNARFGEIFGIEPDEIVRLSPDEVRDRVLPRIKHQRQFLDDLQHVYGRNDLERVDVLELVGPEQTLRRHTAPLVGTDGAFLGRVWTFLDVTEWERLRRENERHVRQLEALVEERTQELLQIQQQLLTSEKLSTVGKMAATVAHELRNILTPMTLELGMLSPSDGEVARTLNRQTRRLMALTHQLLSISAPPRLEVSRADLREVWKNVEALVQSQAEYDSCRLETRVSEKPVPVACNTDQMEHVFVNLALNAFAAMSPDGGTLTVRVESRRDSAVCDFEDTGPGVPEGLIATLFEPFVSGRRGAAGLGLYNCRRIARDHGGNLTLECHDPGKTRFTLRLPLALPGLRE